MGVLCEPGYKNLPDSRGSKRRGRGPRPRKQHRDCRFSGSPSLAAATDYEGVHEIVARAFPDAKPRAVGNFAGQLWAFAVAMKVGDLVVLPRKLTSQIAIGRVTGSYEYRQVDNTLRHARPVEWLQTDLPRTVFEQDLLYSLGAFMTVCNISRNDAERRVVAVAEGKPDPGPSMPIPTKTTEVPGPGEQSEGLPDLSQFAHDQIVAHIQTRFSGHALADLVNAILRADGWVTRLSRPVQTEEWISWRAGARWGLMSPGCACKSSRRTAPPTSQSIGHFRAPCRRSVHSRDCWSVGVASTRRSSRSRELGTSAFDSGTAETWSRPSTHLRATARRVPGRATP